MSGAPERTGTARIPVAGALARDPGTVADLARLVPSAVAPTNSRGETLLYVRGAGERQTAVLLDGAPLTVPWDRRLDLALVPVGAVESLDLVRGPASLAAGPNASGGGPRPGPARARRRRAGGRGRGRRRAPRARPARGHGRRPSGRVVGAGVARRAGAAWRGARGAPPVQPARRRPAHEHRPPDHRRPRPRRAPVGRGVGRGDGPTPGRGPGRGARGPPRPGRRARPLLAGPGLAADHGRRPRPDDGAGPGRRRRVGERVRPDHRRVPGRPLRGARRRPDRPGPDGRRARRRRGGRGDDDAPGHQLAPGLSAPPAGGGPGRGAVPGGRDPGGGGGRGARRRGGRAGRRVARRVPAGGGGRARDGAGVPAGRRRGPGRGPPRTGPGVGRRRARRPVPDHARAVRRRPGPVRPQPRPGSGGDVAGRGRTGGVVGPSVRPGRPVRALDRRDHRASPRWRTAAASGSTSGRAAPWASRPTGRRGGAGSASRSGRR